MISALLGFGRWALGAGLAGTGYGAVGNGCCLTQKRHRPGRRGGSHCRRTFDSFPASLDRHAGLTGPAAKVGGRLARRRARGDRLRMVRLDGVRKAGGSRRRRQGASAVCQTNRPSILPKAAGRRRPSPVAGLARFCDNPLPYPNRVVSKLRGGPTWCATANSRTFPPFEPTGKRRSGIPVRDEGPAWAPGRPRRQGAGREARPERSLPLRLLEALSSVAACAWATSTVASGTTTRGR